MVTSIHSGQNPCDISELRQAKLIIIMIAGIQIFPDTGTEAQGVKIAHY